jgi:hypothetical protein
MACMTMRKQKIYTMAWLFTGTQAHMIILEKPYNIRIKRRPENT